MNSDVCYHEIQYKLSQSFTELISEFFINVDSFLQVFELLNVNNFYHAIPAFIVIFSTVSFIKENDKLFECLKLVNELHSITRSTIKVILRFLFFNTCVNSWLLFQRFIYCYSWIILLNTNETTVVPERWWYRIHNNQGKSGLTLLSADSVGWVICMLIALLINWFISPVAIISTIKTYSCWLRDKLLKQSLIEYNYKLPNIITCIYDEDQPDTTPSMKKKKFRSNKQYIHAPSNEDQCQRSSD